MTEVRIDFNDLDARGSVLENVLPVDQGAHPTWISVDDFLKAWGEGAGK